MYILSAQEQREADAQTIQHLPIRSLDLMEKAAQAFVQLYKTMYSPQQPVFIFCGNGNNGGDGFAIGRLLWKEEYEVHIFHSPSAKTPDCAANFEALKNTYCTLHEWQLELPLYLPKNAVIIDAIFGTGLNRPPSSLYLTAFSYINANKLPIVSVDLPSGLLADQPTTWKTIRATHTISFQFPKLAFLLPENETRVGKWHIVDIGLLPPKNIPDNQLITSDIVKKWYQPRTKFGHKGTYGHALLIGGTYGKAGAAILATRACLRAGAGLVTVHSPKLCVDVIQAAIPEAMVSIDNCKGWIQGYPNLKYYRAIGMGCGIGTHTDTADVVVALLRKNAMPMVIDADALNCIANDLASYTYLKGHILTPHPKEFERLFGESENSFARLALLREKAVEYSCTIVLKGAHSAVALPDGRVWFNSTGNPGMATAGSGDVLTGIITALLAQGYPTDVAALFGVFLHGKAGDFATQKQAHEAVIAGDIIEHIGMAFRDIAAT